MRPLTPASGADANRMTLSRLQLPPRPPAASHSTIGGPPAIWTFFSLPAAKNADEPAVGRPERERAPPSVPGIGLASSARERSQPELVAVLAAGDEHDVTAIRRDRQLRGDAGAASPGPPKDVFSGAAIVNCVASAGGGVCAARAARATVPPRQQRRSRAARDRATRHGSIAAGRAVSPRRHRRAPDATHFRSRSRSRAL